METKQTVMASPLVDKVIKLEPIIRGGGMLPKGHDGEFMYTGALRIYTLPKSLETNLFIPVLTEDEQVWFEKKLHLKEGSLSFYNRDNDFWGSFKIKVDKNGLTLNLNDVMDNLKWRVLKILKEVAPDPNSRYDSPSYKFMLVDSNYEIEERASKSDRIKLAYQEFGKLQVGESKMRNFLRVYGKKAASNATREFLVASIDKIIDENIDRFLEIVQDSNFEHKLLIEDAMDARALIRAGKSGYALPGGDKIANTMEEAIDWIKDPRNSTEVLTIKARIENNK